MKYQSIWDRPSRARYSFWSEKERPMGKIEWVVWGLLAAIAITAVLTTGCQTTSQIGNKAATASAGLSQNLDTAHSELGAAVPHADAEGKGHLAAADAAIASGKSKLPAIDEGLAQIPVLQDQVKKLKDQVSKLEHQFWSPRQIALVWWTVGIVAGILTLLTVLYLVTPFGPVIGTTAASLFHVVSLGIPKFFHWIVGKIQTNVATAKLKAAGITLLTPPAAQPSAPSATPTTK